MVRSLTGTLSASLHKYLTVTPPTLPSSPSPLCLTMLLFPTASPTATILMTVGYLLMTQLDIYPSTSSSSTVKTISSSGIHSSSVPPGPVSSAMMEWDSQMTTSLVFPVLIPVIRAMKQKTLLVSLLRSPNQTSYANTTFMRQLVNVSRAVEVVTGFPTEKMVSYTVLIVLIQLPIKPI